MPIMIPFHPQLRHQIKEPLLNLDRVLCLDTSTQTTSELEKEIILSILLIKDLETSRARKPSLWEVSKQSWAWLTRH